MNLYIKTTKVKRRPSEPGFQLAQTFFGFKPADRATLHEILFDLVWQGEGRWDLETIYSMPIPMRRFWIKKFNSTVEKQMQGQTNTPPTSDITRGPSITP